MLWSARPKAVLSADRTNDCSDTMAALKPSDRPPYGMVETLLGTAVAVGGAIILYVGLGLWGPLGLADHRGVAITLADLWMCAVVIVAVRRRWSVIDYFALARPRFRVVGVGIAAQLALELIRTGLTLMELHNSCLPISGCPGLSLEMPAASAELIAAWFATLVVIGPFSEEIVFRGFLYAGLARAIKSPVAVIAIVALAFTCAHPDVVLHPFGFGTFWRFGCGLLYGVLRWKCGSLWPAIAAHVTSDTVAFTTTTFVAVTLVPR